MKITTLLLGVILSVSAIGQGNGYLGISMKKSKDKGVRISEVLDNGAAKTYELKQNDIIFSVNGVFVNSGQELKNQIKAKNWGEEIKVVFTREGHTLTKLVTLGNRAEKVTYHVERKKQKETGDYVWIFNKETYITISNGKPTSIERINRDLVDSKNDKLIAHTIIEGIEVPPYFSDLNDKLAIIEAIDARNAGKKRYPSVTVYIKTYTKPETSKKEIAPKLSVDLKAFPNPSLGEFQFTLKTDKTQSKSVVWQVIDISGKLVIEGNVADFEGTTTKSLNLTNQGTGVYLLKVVYDNKLFTEKLVVK